MTISDLTVQEILGVISASQNQNLAVEKVGDNHNKPRAENEKEEMEQPQIRVPIDVPKRDEKEKLKEEVQLDRPDQGLALPVGEAHRHEPPVPHDEVVVDEGQDREEPEEEKPPPANKDVMVEGKPVLEKEQAQPKPVPEQAKEDSAQEKLKELPVKDPKPVPEVAAREDERPPYKDLELDSHNRRRDVDVKDSAKEGVKPAEKENEPGEKEKPLPPEQPEPAQPEQREIRNVEENADNKLEEVGKEKILDHEVLLQVIKEQQVQQKQLLDQQAKLLAVIEEQHKEIHQQRQEEGGEEKPKPVETHQEPGQPLSKNKGREEGFASKTEDAAKNALNERADHPLHGLNNQPLDSEGQRRQPAAGPGGELKQIHKLTRDPPKNPASLDDGENIAEHHVGKNSAEKLVEPVRSDSQVAGADREHQEKQKEGHDTHLAQEKRKNAQKIDEIGGRAVGQKEMLGEAKVHAVAGKIAQSVSEGEPFAGVNKVELQDQEKQADGAYKSKVTENVRQNQEVPGAVNAGEKQTFSLGQVDGLQGQGGSSRDRAVAGFHIPHTSHANEFQLRAESEPQNPGKLQKSDGEPVLKTELIAAAREHENVKPNRDLKLKEELDLRRRRRDLEEEEEGRVIIRLNPLPNMKVNDLRSALETQLNQAAEGAQQALHSRQIKQMPVAEEEV
ncbi:UNVERIFIED_CONTAM: hypothetical protein K2H54_022645 [Gekko kuhli]